MNAIDKPTQVELHDTLTWARATRDAPSQLGTLRWVTSRRERRHRLRKSVVLVLRLAQLVHWCRRTRTNADDLQYDLFVLGAVIVDLVRIVNHQAAR